MRRIPQWRGWPDVEDAKSMLEAGHNWDQYSTPDLVMAVRSQVGREFTAFRRKVKEILSTREHLPNKAEKKALRQEKARAQRNR